MRKKTLANTPTYRPVGYPPVWRKCRSCRRCTGARPSPVLTLLQLENWWNLQTTSLGPERCQLPTALQSLNQWTQFSLAETDGVSHSIGLIRDAPRDNISMIGRCIYRAAPKILAQFLYTLNLSIDWVTKLFHCQNPVSGKVTVSLASH